jgi:formylglycine-generating enzyme required for sulfatase activity
MNTNAYFLSLVMVAMGLGLSGRAQVQLFITGSPTNVTLLWPYLPDREYVLEEATTLSPPVWIPSPSGTANPVTVAPLGQAKYFRLRLSPSNMVWIPPGTFTMGSPTNEAERGSNEIQHEVTISRGFWMGVFEVTQGEYLDVTGSNPSFFNGIRTNWPAASSGTDYGLDLNRPVERVSWFDATNYCDLLTKRGLMAGSLPSGYIYRLPTEAEWEYACRAGTTTAFHYGTELRDGMANFNGRYEYHSSIGTITNVSGTVLWRSTAVGGYDPNPWGLYDMHGNVYEWCLDWYGDNAEYPVQDQTDPTGPMTGSERVYRGGTWWRGGVGCRSANRLKAAPTASIGATGFRVVLAPVLP